MQVVTEASLSASLPAEAISNSTSSAERPRASEIAPGFGGPHLGFFACAERHVRQMPGRLVGETVDEEGNRAFCLTLSTREQHIRRAKATSNICTNQGLMALAATVWLEAVGGAGLRELAASCLARSEELKRRIADRSVGRGASPIPEPDLQRIPALGPGTGPELRRSSRGGECARRCAHHNLGRTRGRTAILVAVTERNSAADIEAFAAALEKLSMRHRAKIRPEPLFFELNPRRVRRQGYVHCRSLDVPPVEPCRRPPGRALARRPIPTFPISGRWRSSSTSTVSQPAQLCGR